MNRLAWVALLVCFPAVAEEPRVTDMQEDDTERTPLHTVVPAYPKDARRDRIEGEVQVCFHVDRKGKPYRIAVRRSTHRVFEKPVRNAVRASSYVPLEEGEQTSGIKSCRTFRFTLRPVADEPGSPVRQTPD